MKQEIKDHRLTDAAFEEAADHGGRMDPTHIVIHYSGGTAAGGIDWLTRQERPPISAHVMIDRKGVITQMVPFNFVAFHAGRSSLGELREFNEFSIGIELENWGPLDCQRGEFLTYTKRVIAPEWVIEAKHRNTGWLWTQRPDYWHKFTCQQEMACKDLCEALVVEYGVVGIVGHDTIAPARKFDPGPASANLMAVLQGLTEEVSEDVPEPLHESRLVAHGGDEPEETDNAEVQTEDDSGEGGG